MVEPRMECLWYVCSKVPSLKSPGMTVLDETHQANVREPVYSSTHRLLHNRGEKYDSTGPLMSVEDAKRMTELFLTPEEELENLAVTDWFTPDFTRSIFWYCWSSMLAFQDHHSVIEVKRYLLRFMMYGSGLTHLAGILHAEYNDYDSIIKPMHVYLQTLGVKFQTGTAVTDIEVTRLGGAPVVTALRLRHGTEEYQILLTTDDLVFFTNGSLTQNATLGSTNTVVSMNRDTRNRGLFSLWEKLAAQDGRFGNPAPFISDVDRTNWISFFPTIRGDHTLYEYMEKKTGDKAGLGGAITIVDSSWKLGFILYNKYYPDQPDDVDVFWAYGQLSDVPGDYIKKPMRECTGAEMFAELLFHLGLEDRIEQILSHSKISTAMMPYVTSQFMPRKVSDRPRVIPEGCVNLAFMGQFVEVPGDVVFTVETSVRTALMGVWGLTGLDKPMIPIYEPAYDVRVVFATLKANLGIERWNLAAVVRLLRSQPRLGLVLRALRGLPKPRI